MWVDFLTTQTGRQFRVRVVFAVRHPGDGTTTRGAAICASPPEAFAAFDQGCAAALESYDFSN